MHLVEDRRVLHHLPTSAGVPAAAGSGGGVGVGAHGGSRFSSRLRGGPGSGGGDKGSEPARPGRMGQATAVNARVVLAGVRDRRDGQGPGWRCVHPRPAGSWSGSPPRSRRAVQEPRRPRPRPRPSATAQQAAERPSRCRVQAVVPRVRPPPCPAPRCRAASGTRHARRGPGTRGEGGEHGGCNREMVMTTSKK